VDYLLGYRNDNTVDQAVLTNFLDGQTNVRSGLVLGSRWFSSEAALLVKSYLNNTNSDPNTYISLREEMARISPTTGIFSYVMAKYAGVESGGDG
jgi:hypothetical protein